MFNVIEFIVSIFSSLIVVIANVSQIAVSQGFLGLVIIMFVIIPISGLIAFIAVRS